MPFGGRITHKNDTTLLSSIPGPPAAALAVTGGLCKATSGVSKPHEAFRWAATLAEAKGELLANGHFQTTVTSSISRAWARNNPHVFEADVLRITMVSDHFNLGPASIRIKEAVFGGTTGMKLDGDRIEVVYNEDLDRNPTFNGFQDKYQSNKAFFNRHQNKINPGNVRFGDPIPQTSGGYAITSIARQVKWRGKTYNGNTLTLAGFGTIYFGEVLMNENNRRITMVRLHMGSDLGAHAAYAEADPNGTWGN